MVKTRALILVSTLLLCGCGPQQTSTEKTIDRAQRRSLAWRYSRLMTSKSSGDQKQHIKAVESDVAVYNAIGLSPRATRRYKAMLAATRRRADNNKHT